MQYFLNNYDRIFSLTIEHVYIILVTLIISLLIAIPIGILIPRIRGLHTPVLSVLGIMYTIPSLALFALMVPFFGLGFKSAIIALVAYSQMILVRNIATGMKNIDPAIIEAARGMGMGQWRILWKVEFPLALPVIIAGIRIATVAIMGIAAIAAYINAGGLGEMIFEGIYQSNATKIIIGTIIIALLTISADIGLRFAEKKLSPGV